MNADGAIGHRNIESNRISLHLRDDGWAGEYHRGEALIDADMVAGDIVPSWMRSGLVREASGLLERPCSRHIGRPGGVEKVDAEVRAAAEADPLAYLAWCATIDWGCSPPLLVK